MDKYEIVMVDDDQDDIDMMKEAFESISYGQHFTHYTSGKQLFSFLESLTHPGLYPSIAILDYNMPESNGDEILAKLRRDARYDNIVVVFFSTSISPYQKAKLESMGSVCCIVKPNTYQEFLQVAMEFKHAIDQKNASGSEKAAFELGNITLGNSI